MDIDDILSRTPDDSLDDIDERDADDGLPFRFYFRHMRSRFAAITAGVRDEIQQDTVHVEVKEGSVKTTRPVRFEWASESKYC